MSITAVAKRAGVSIATVSRVLNDLPVVREATVKQVRAAIAEVGYSPLRVRRSRNPKTLVCGNVGIAVIGGGQGWLSMPVLASVVSGITTACRENGQQLFLEEVQDSATLAGRIRAAKLAGLIAFIAEPIDNSTLLALKQQVPIVRVMGGEACRNVIDHVSADNGAVGDLAFKYLHKMGCQRFIFLASNPNWQVIRVRAQAFSNAAADMGYIVENRFVVGDEAGSTSPLWSSEIYPGFEQAVDAIASEPEGVTGLFVPTDFQTVQVMPLLTRHGLKLGKNVHLVSCDKEQIRLAHLDPCPPSIDLNGAQIGRAALRQLTQRIAAPDAPTVRVLVAPQLTELNQ